MVALANYSSQKTLIAISMHIGFLIIAKGMMSLGQSLLNSPRVLSPLLSPRLLIKPDWRIRSEGRDLFFKNPMAFE